MPLSGGASDKAGNRYELLWTVVNMARVLTGKAETISLEPVGDEGEGVEFTVTLPTGTEYHQVKRQRTGHGVWSLATLKGVLGHFYQKLNVQSAKTVFVSTHAAHPIDELVERAQSAASWEEFERWFLSTTTWSMNFSKFHQQWGAASNEESYERLQRIRVVTISENELRELAHAKLGILLDGDPANATDILAQFALDRTHHTLTANNIWEHLQQRCFNRQTWAYQASVTDTVQELNGIYRTSIRSPGIAGGVIRRQETERILAHLKADDTRQVALVTGTAGVGKTSVISQVLDDTEIRALPMLALRMDRLEPAHRPEELGKHLGLPESPVRTLAAVARDQDCLLVIDQLDAVSVASGRNPEFYDCIGAMLEEARHHPNMRVLGACRKFDVDNDIRLRSLVSEDGIADEFQVEPFDRETVQTILKRLGFDPGQFNAKQIDLLALPLHMHLLSEVANGGAVDIGVLQSTKDLYDAFWRDKRRALQSRNVASGQMRTVIDLVVDHMTGRELLFVPESLLDDHADDMAAMASENILVRDGSRVSFFHESFLDYAFARRMAPTGDDLATFILAGEQSLFVRSQVRQVLLHRRYEAPKDALRDIDDILNSGGIRPHLKAIVISLLGTLDDPTEEEWRLLEPSLTSELSGHVLRSINGSDPWFDLLDCTGALDRWLNAGDETLTNRAMRLIRGIVRSRPERVAQMLDPFRGSSEAWNQRLVSTVLSADLGTSREIFDLTLELLKIGAADDALTPQNGFAQLWHTVRTLAGTNAEWACELIAACCDRLLVLTVTGGNSNPSDTMNGLSTSDAHGVQRAAAEAPRIFVKQLLPIVCRILNGSTDQSKAPPWRDTVWYPEFYANGHNFRDLFLLSMESAMRWLAENDSDAFGKLAVQLWVSDFATIHVLLSRAYEAGSEALADEATDYVTDVLTGFDGRYPGSGARWAVAKLLQVVSPHCSEARLAALEQAILNHYPEFEKTPNGRRRHGLAQFELLSAVDESRLSQSASLRLSELRRKFPEPGEPGPSIIRLETVQSPIPEDSASHMTDANWLSAMAQHSQEYPPYAGDALVGGAVNLSRVLESLTKGDPARFANLAHQMPDSVNPVYFKAILQGLAGSELSMDQIIAVCLRCHQLPGRPLGCWITKPLVHFPDEVLPDAALEMTAWYATQDSYPEPGSTDYQGDLMTDGINCVRGTAADLIARLIFQNRHYLDFFRPYLDIMVNDLSTAVRAMVAHTLLGALRYDRDFAVGRFVELCADDEVLATPFVEQFLKYGVQTHFDDLEPVLSRMLSSDDDDVATVGARQSCLASLTVGEAVPLGQQCVSGSKPLRLGAAEVYAANLKASALRAECEAMLAQLFNDPNDKVRGAAASCFRHFSGWDLGEYVNLANHYVESTAFTAEYNPLLTALEETTAHIPALVVAACERFFDLAAEDGHNVNMIDTQNVVNLVVRAYSQTSDVHIRNRCLDLIDRMHLLGVYGLDNTLAALDR